jgi:hypothetical protein
MTGTPGIIEEPLSELIRERGEIEILSENQML